MDTIDYKILIDINKNLEEISRQLRISNNIKMAELNSPRNNNDKMYSIQELEGYDNFENK